MSDTVTTTAEPIILEAFNPAELLMDENSRADAEATVTKAFVTACKTHAASALELPVHGDPDRKTGCGNGVPITIVRRPDGRLRVRVGHRRTIGCERGGVLVMGFIAGDEGDAKTDRRARLLDQWTENNHREGMTTQDETRLLLTLFEDGMSEAALSRATGMTRPQITASLTVGRSETAAKAADKWDFLTLDQAAVLAEFEDDKQALTILVQTAQSWPERFEHRAEQLRTDRAERETKAAFIAGLEEQGIHVYGDRPGVPWKFNLANLRGSDGNEITPEEHAACPGRAVTITQEWGWAPGAEDAYRAANGLTADDDLDNVSFGSHQEAAQAGYEYRWQIDQYLCVGPEENGHTNILGQPGDSPTEEQKTAEDQAAEAAAEAEERRRVRQRNNAWRAANDIRTRHLKALLGRKTPPPAALKLIVAAIARGETQPLMSSHGHQTACELLGLKGNGVVTDYRDQLLAALERASEKGAQIIALAMVLGAAEDSVRDVCTWRRAEDRWYAEFGIPAAARYLAWLAEHTGYGLSDLESKVAAHAAASSSHETDEAAEAEHIQELTEEEAADTQAAGDRATGAETEQAHEAACDG